MKKRVTKLTVESYLVVPAGALLATAWANTNAESYYTFASSWSFAVNDVAMTLFFALVTQEIVEAMMPGGALHTWRRAIMPIVAAAGGLAVSVLLYLAYLKFVDEVMLFQVWPTVGAIDLAFAYFLARILFKDRAAVAFTLLLAVASDLVVLPFWAVRYPLAEFHLSGVVLIVLAISIAFGLRRFAVDSFWPYILVCGPICWWGFKLSALHPALALVPLVPFVPHAPRDLDLDLFADAPTGIHHSISHLEHVLSYPVQIALFFFALVNAGVVFAYFEPGTWALPLATLVGRPIGVMAAVSLAVAGGLRIPLRRGWAELLVVGIIASVGFTFSLFVATAVLPPGALLTQMKMSALSTVAGSIVALAVAWLLGVGRFMAPAHQSK